MPARSARVALVATIALVRLAMVAGAVLAVLAVLAMLALAPARADGRRDARPTDDDVDAAREVEPDVAVDLERTREITAASAIGAPGGVTFDLTRPPPIAEVLEAAYEAAGLDRNPAKSWIRRARIAGLVPWLTVRTGWDADWRDDEPDVGRSRTFEVRATWRLDRLLFDGRELQVASIDAARRRERRRLASQVIRSYFAWRKVTARAARDGRFTLAAEAATAELDALTDGWFSDRGTPQK